MAIRVALDHTTEYRFDRPVRLSPHLVRLRPAPHVRTPIHRYSLKVTPENHFLNWQQDAFGNYVARLVFPEPTRELKVAVEVIADLVTVNPFDFFLEPGAESFPFTYEPQLAKELAPYRELGETGGRFADWVRAVSREPQPTVDFLVALNQRLQSQIGYVVRMEPGIQTCEQTLESGRGSCRDSAWLLVQVLRHLGLAARFVSGYLVQLVADQKSLDGPSGPDQDFTDLHAWAEVYLPGAGWVGLDPTSGLFAGEGHIPLSCTPDPASAAPISGYTDRSEVTLQFHNRVTRIQEDPRVTRPYSEEQWQRILALGDRVDAQLQAEDVRLTMGGEPTFVSIDDMDSAQWNTAALGDHKLERAEILFRRLHERFGQGGVLHYGQGKWYPGEPLPRWAFSCYWRKDGGSLWQDPRWLADPTRDYGVTQTQAAEFARRLCVRLGLPVESVATGFEDGLYYLWREGSLPTNLDVTDSRIRDPLERERLRRLFERGLDQPAGYALPLAWDEQRARWRSSIWNFRRGAMFLLPGDSPMGLRLPLDALVWEPEPARQRVVARDPFEFKPPLGNEYGEVFRRFETHAEPAAANSHVYEQSLPPPGERGSQSLVRTALCVEAREGRLYLFLPPLERLEHSLHLLAAIEATARDQQVPVVLEGYEPPRDERLNLLMVTPDPGVIEVNVHPAASWRQLLDTTESLYEEARLARLGTEKFMLDGRHTGTGGGNHITIGGATPADSPILRRPHLLSSLVLYWQNHPSLSYLFSGLFIGPTSQAPRVDEARDEILHELEIALQQLPLGEVDKPWLVDRLFRNLLVDMTGNTHRAEFCIDKLYTPQSAGGRKGLLEFRGFEMPPHARMSLVQMLLLRALVAQFWSTPYLQGPVRWGTELHDKFMLPHFVRSDFLEVMQDLNRWGYAFEATWFDPFLEFRFPHYGSVNLGDIELELRAAIEPWHVLGEEVTAQGTARFVDSSVERVQIKATGLVPGRHLVTCNGRRVPLRNTGRRGEYVAGVRFKAWQPPSGLHPTIPVQAPLVFDLVDTWNNHSLGGCTYHVAHPSGRNYETLPVNANEAEARRLARFLPQGHSQGPRTVPAEEPSLDYPVTLDLRYQP